MAITVVTQDNPTVAHTGKLSADATIIYSGFSTGTTSYNIESLDGSQDLQINSGSDVSLYPQVIHFSVDRLEVVLDFRTWYRVRTSHNIGGNITVSDWTTFKTRDKKYSTPDACNQFQINPVTGYTTSGQKAVVIATNTAKATTEYTSSGATVTNTGVDVNTDSITYTSTGATVISKDA